jgi:Kef-type K+ transport system membrane component KefB
MVLGAVAAFLAIRARGETLDAPPPPASPVAEVGLAAGSGDALLGLLVALAAVVVAGQLLGRLAVRLGQPPVIGEVVAGILLGPSLLGPRLSELILPAASGPHLGVIAQLGVILYMFIVGLELDLASLGRRPHAAVTLAHASILVPFLLGALLALGLYPRLSSSDVPFTSFALFLGVAMSITAFPVLARILADRGLSRTELGVLALCSAAIADVSAWCLLAFVVGVAQAEIGAALSVAAGALAFIAVMLFVVGPLARSVVRRWGAAPLSRARFALVFLGLLLSALATEAIGIHAIFGAFLLGAVLPHDSAVARDFPRQLEHVTSIVLLPAFFAFTGMRTRIDLVSGVEAWLICGAIVLLATAGKFGGALIAARLCGLGWRAGAVLGALMNTRGLMEIVVLNVGLDLGILSPQLFAMLVLMALATTVATAPLLDLLQPRAAAAATSRPAVGEGGAAGA